MTPLEFSRIAIETLKARLTGLAEEFSEEKQSLELQLAGHQAEVTRHEQEAKDAAEREAQAAAEIVPEEQSKA